VKKLPNRLWRARSGKEEEWREEKPVRVKRSNNKRALWFLERHGELAGKRQMRLKGVAYYHSTWREDEEKRCGLLPRPWGWRSLKKNPANS